MEYQVLARRYRPRRFDEVVGQESVAATLRGGIQQERIAHAYLFAGPRGVGKTSMARIFAKALNCPKAADRSQDRAARGQPCNECSVCESIHLGQDIDVVELDGASHRGIEDIRGIIEGVNRPATRSPYKVFIIDEVHMLTREAFNALLKTLEEPPGHVKFIFATTEPHRIPETVLSRCQRFDFHPIGEEAIVRRLSQILESEGRTVEGGLVEPGLLERVARYGKGGLRDAQTLLDQLMTFCEGPLTIADLERITGRVPERSALTLADAALSGDTSGVYTGLRACFAEGADPSMVLEQLVDVVRERIHRRVREDDAEPHAPGAEPGGGPSFDRLLGSLQILVDAASRLKYSAFAEISVEVTLLRIARLEEPRSLDEVLRKLAEIEAKESPPQGVPPVASRAALQAAPRAAPAASAAPQAARPRAAVKTPRPPEPPRPAPARRDQEPSTADRTVERTAGAALDFRRLESVWDQIRIELEAKFPSIAPMFRDTTPARSSEVPDLFLLEVPQEFHFRQVKNARNQEAFLGVVREVSQEPWRCQVVKSRQQHVGKGKQGHGPTSEQTRSEASLPPAAVEEPPPSSDPRQSPIVQKSLDLFNGRIV